MNSGLFKNSIVYLLVLLAVAALIFSIFSSPGDSNDLEITTVAEQIKAGEVAAERMIPQIEEALTQYEYTPSDTSIFIKFVSIVGLKHLN